MSAGKNLRLDEKLALRYSKGELLGTTTVEEACERHRVTVASGVLGATNIRHPMVSRRMGETKSRPST